MIYKIEILFLICLLTTCSSAGEKEVATTGELLRQAAFYGERLQFQPVLETYRLAIRQAGKGKDSVALSVAYLETGKIYRKQSLKRKALENGQKALSYIKSPTADSLRLELYREIGDVYTLSGQADSAFHYYEMAGCRIKQATILRQYSRYRQKRNVVSLSEADFRSSEIYLRFHSKKEWKPVPKDWEELLQAFNRAYPDFRERLKRKIPKLSEQEWRMCCLIKMEVPPSTAAMLLCCTNQAISMRRVRLYQKITGEKGTPELCDSFIRDF